MKGKTYVFTLGISVFSVSLFQGILGAPANIGSYIGFIMIGWSSAFLLIKNYPKIASLKESGEMQTKEEKE